MKNPSIYVSQQNLFEVEAINTKPKEKITSDSSYVFDIVDALSAPVLTFSQQWADTIPERILDIVQISRMKTLMVGEKLASYAE